MSDIELVIKIPEEIYHNIKIGNSRNYKIRNIAMCAIENGKPLPKDHGVFTTTENGSSDR